MLHDWALSDLGWNSACWDVVNPGGAQLSDSASCVGSGRLDFSLRSRVRPGSPENILSSSLWAVATQGKFFS